MAAWYAQHYGKHAGPQPADPGPQQAARVEVPSNSKHSSVAVGEAPRWWQDPKQVLPQSASPPGSWKNWGTVPEKTFWRSEKSFLGAAVASSRLVACRCRASYIFPLR